MEKISHEKQVQIDFDKDRKFFEQEGSSRVITSGSLYTMFALVGSSFIWLFTIFATGWEGLQYFGLTTAIIGMVGVVGIGLSRYFIAEIKEAFIINEELGRIKAASYSKILILIGLTLSVVITVMGLIITRFLFIENEFFEICIYASSVATIIEYLSLTLSNGLAIKNRYDIIAFLGIFRGINLFLWLVIFIFLNLNPTWFAYYSLFNIFTFFLFLYFFRKFAPYSLKEILRANLSSKKMKRSASVNVAELIKDTQIFSFLKNSIYSTITNLESSGIFGDLLLVITVICIAILNPFIQGLAVSLLTILLTYGAVKNVILYYSAPLNIEIAEANTKKHHQIIEDSVNDSARISSILGLGFLTAMTALSGQLLLILHEDFFIIDNKFDSELFSLAQSLFILIILSQFAYGYSTLFGNALIGSGNARYAAIGFIVTLMIIIFITPTCIIFFGILGVGISMIVSVLFLLPYMLIQLKLKLNINFNFKLIRLIPNLIIMFFFFLLFPIVDSITLIFSIILGAILYMSLNPFFGVSISRAMQMINDLFNALKLKSIGGLIVKIMNAIYNFSPLNKEKIVLKKF